jgi:hypothetical protein
MNKLVLILGIVTLPTQQVKTRCRLDLQASLQSDKKKYLNFHGFHDNDAILKISNPKCTTTCTHPNHFCEFSLQSDQKYLFLKKKNPHRIL